MVDRVTKMVAPVVKTGLAQTGATGADEGCCASAPVGPLKKGYRTGAHWRSLPSRNLTGANQQARCVS